MQLKLEKKDIQEGAYTHNLHFNNLLLSNEVYIENETIFNNNVEDNFDKNLILSLRGNDLPLKIEFGFYLEEEGYPNLTTIIRNQNILTFSFGIFFEDIISYKFEITSFFKHIKEELEKYENIKFIVCEDYKNYDRMFIQIDYISNDLTSTFSNHLDKTKHLFKELFLNIKNKIEGKNWNDNYYKDESFFTNNFVIPLLKRMGFNQVMYTHGVDEFGKDIVFSKIDEFGDKIYSAVQIKAGDISGNANGKVNEIINQIDDAFKIPFKLIGKSDDIYISSLIIIISGKFTNNAKTKILHKVDNTLLGSIKFLDKEQLMNL